MAKKIILDTDIGSDIDDSWALGLILASPELDLALAVSSADDTVYKAKVIAKFLERTGHTDIPIGIGIKTSDAVQELSEWVRDYDIAKYPGIIHEDGVQALIDTVMDSDEPVTLIVIGPMTNIAAAYDREPRIAEKCDIICTHGCIYSGHRLDVIEKQSDYNVRADIRAARRVYEAPWEIFVSPLDISAHLVIGDDNYQKLLSVRDSNPIVGAILESFDYWMVAMNAPYYTGHSTALYDLAPVYIAIHGDYNLIIEDHWLSIDDGGFTNDDPESGRHCRCAVYWKYVDMFYKFVTDRLCGEI